MSVTAGDLAALIGAEIVGDPSLELTGVAKIEEAGDGEIAFVANPTYRKFLADTKASAAIVDEAPEDGASTYLVTPEPYRAFLKVLRHFHPEAPTPEHPERIGIRTDQPRRARTRCPRGPARAARPVQR